MSERDPIDILEGITDAAIDPDPAFSERLLDDMLLSLAPDSTALTPGPIIAVSEAESLPVLDLLSETNKGTDHMNRTPNFYRGARSCRRHCTDRWCTRLHGR